ncbi:hypothetical protein AKG11_03520 [Shinella sp. SUS2]|uniref:hypothetical protein n=1 Tax=unclassified Shinella TaxID=2643062 RepID=UPI0006811C2D|nr:MULTISPECIES: hypothetical protein [unclassified Shinella]KNY18221.1 hypothetical protein AKG11_03520 [Shinella sp. SUS2]KOC77416.1 hypothetical protein AKG10_00990 [Shinella sp. GWS1]
MSVGRIFNEEVIAIGDTGGRALAMKIVCAECGGVAYFPHQTGKTRKPPIAAQQSFQNKGWVVGKGPRKDFCPFHAAPASRKGRAAMAVNGKTIELAANPPVRAEPPREPSVEDRRIINLKLMEVYTDGGYVSPWTDQRVADDLNVPRAWVSAVREFSFGPEGSNPLFDEFLAASSAFLADNRALATLRVEFLKTSAEIEERLKVVQEEFLGHVRAACRRVSESSSDIRRRGDDLDGKARDISTLAKRVEKEIGR